MKTVGGGGVSGSGSIASLVRKKLWPLFLFRTPIFPHMTKVMSVSEPRQLLMLHEHWRRSSKAQDLCLVFVPHRVYCPVSLASIACTVLAIRRCYISFPCLSSML